MNNTLYLIDDVAEAIRRRVKPAIRFVDKLAKAAITMASSHVQFVHPKHQ